MAAPTLVFPAVWEVGNLRLRQWDLRKEQDRATLERAFTVGDVVASLDQTRDLAVLGVKDWIQHRVPAANASDRVLWLAVCPGPGFQPAAGLLLDRTHDDHPSEWEIGVWVLPEHRGRGLARRAVQAAVDWMNTQGVTCVWFLALHPASDAIAEHLQLERVKRPPAHLEIPRGTFPKVFRARARVDLR